MKKASVCALVLLSCLLLFCACVNYVPREEEISESSAVTAVREPDDSAATGDGEPEGGDTEISTDADGFPNLPEDGYTKRY